MPAKVATEAELWHHTTMSKLHCDPSHKMVPIAVILALLVLLPITCGFAALMIYDDRSAKVHPRTGS